MTKCTSPVALCPTVCYCLFQFFSASLTLVYTLRSLLVHKSACIRGKHHVLEKGVTPPNIKLHNHVQSLTQD